MTNKTHMTNIVISSFKNTLFWLILYLTIHTIFLSGVSVFAQNTTPNPASLEIVPKSDNLWSIYDRVMKWTGSIRDNQNEVVKSLSTADQVASGVMTWNTILDYGVYILRFLSQAWLLVGALMLIYTGYTYILSVINWESPDSKLVPNSIKWILVIIFSYAIIRILTRAFLT
jgi:hypothetical protein